MSDHHGLGAHRTPDDVLASVWPISAALGERVTAPASYHDPRCSVTLDQNGYGACEAFSGAYVQSALELTDEGRELLPNVLDPLHTYAAVKGLPWPFTPEQDRNAGTTSQALWAYTCKHGWWTKDGSTYRKDASYFNVGKPAPTADFLDALQQTILQLGPTQFTAAWPHNWYGTDSTGHMAMPSSIIDGGHAFEGCGWQKCATCKCGFDTLHHQSWGLPWGHHPTLPAHFLIHGVDLPIVAWECWKVADVVTPPPVPTAELTMQLLSRPARLFDGPLAAGQLVTIPVAGLMGIATNAIGAVLTLRVVRANKGGWLYAGPDLGAVPTVSTLDYNAGQTDDGFPVTLLTDGRLTLYSTQPLSRLVIDATGFLVTA